MCAMKIHGILARLRTRAQTRCNDAVAKLIPIYIYTRSDIQGRDLYYEPPQMNSTTLNEVQDIA